MAFDIREFDLAAMLRCGIGLQKCCGGSATMEQMAEAVVRYLHSEFRDAESGQSSFVLTRFFTTVPFQQLPPGLQREAERGADPAALLPATRCLTLLATAGDEPDWCDRTRSHGHQAIPLTSVEMVQQAPMIARLLVELGVDVAALVGPGPGMLEGMAGRSYNVFHVEEARGSTHIPAQAEFVERYGVRSVIGFGGMLPRGELFAVILFSRVPVPADRASRFRKVATDVKALAIPFGAEKTFRAEPRPQP